MATRKIERENERREGEAEEIGFVVYICAFDEEEISGEKERDPRTMQGCFVVIMRNEKPAAPTVGCFSRPVAYQPAFSFGWFDLS
ncbi:uncharacterized protein N7446_006521 [Penicillium canescens]|uniref:Uncharacterized protein n=1 Tax=Penicillium canescens TaxID=5083 RepID=A0AAD6NCL0_PENCN|nr:uncharacterized protein N7446_006521 [Penicillium canescens]KAJ6051884.1 hypothetical protein N7460_002418 [Penicillium canescens]KAJ6062401.1 hypothetical protein N7446_006521 [Penicillium canescens]KAJ6065648.1 hypothetical protein N7444_001301 [Penicillium canescens]